MTTKTEKLASIAQWDAILARYPLGASVDLLRQLTVVIGANGVTLYLLVKGRLRPVEVVFLVAVEAVFLIGIAWIQAWTVPASARMKSDQTPGQKLFHLAFGLFWLTVVYGLILGDAITKLKHETGWPSVEALLRSGIFWPLSLCLLGALLDAVRDWRFWSERGGFFLSTPGFNAGARVLTLFLGGIPFLIPMAAVGWAITRLFGGRRSGDSPNGAVIGFLVVGVFGVMLWLLNAGVSGWAVGFCSAKVVSEVFIVCMPLIAKRARAEESAGLGRRRGRALKES